MRVIKCNDFFTTVCFRQSTHEWRILTPNTCAALHPLIIWVLLLQGWTWAVLCTGSWRHELPCATVEAAPWVAVLAVEVAALVVGGSASRPLPVVVSHWIDFSLSPWLIAEICLCLQFMAGCWFWAILRFDLGAGSIDIERELLWCTNLVFG